MISTRARLIQLAERRARLQQLASSEREVLASMLVHSDEASLLVQRVFRILNELRKRPWIVAGGAALMFAYSPRRALGWLMKGWSAWRMFRGAQRWWRQFAGRSPDAA